MSAEDTGLATREAFLNEIREKVPTSLIPLLKVHLWDEEKTFFEHGNLGFPVFDLPFGRVGMFICQNGWFPETTGILRLQGIDIALNPTNWVYVPGVITEEKPVSPDMHSAFAHCNSMFIISCDRVGTERGCPFLGLSNIAGPNGTIVRASWDKEEVITAEINVIAGRYTVWTKFADMLKDRRIDVYDAFLGYKGLPHPRVWQKYSIEKCINFVMDCTPLCRQIG